MKCGEGRGTDGDGADSRTNLPLFSLLLQPLLPPLLSPLLQLISSSLTCEEINVHAGLGRRLHSENKLEVPAVLSPLGTWVQDPVSSDLFTREGVYLGGLLVLADLAASVGEGSVHVIEEQGPLEDVVEQGVSQVLVLRIQLDQVHLNEHSTAQHNTAWHSIC
jgi:hypothetical protein